MNRHCKVLELDKILERLSGRTACADAAEAARELVPQTDFFEVKRLLDQTLEAYSLTARFGAPSFGSVQNIDSALRRASTGGVLTMRELLDIAEDLRVIRSLSEWSKNADPASLKALAEFFDVLSPNKYLEEKITNAILSEDSMSDHASPALYDIRRKIRVCGDRAREHLEKMIRSANYQKYLQESIITLRGDRFVVPVKAEHRADVPGLVHDTSSSGATVFVEPMAVVELNNEIKVLTAKEQAEIERILAELSAETGQFADNIRYSYQAVVELNLVFAKASLAFEMRAAPPVLCSSGEIMLKKARHPLLDPKTVQPIDVALGGDYSTLVITGPNTGGKTVTLKTIGLLTLMAMCGLMIPAADESKISVFDEILADIGDEQSIEQSLSTFSSHMTNIVAILQTAGPKTLVLMDELGAGTDPVEGAALATSILEELRSKGAKIAATTHYAELKAYALDTTGVENASCEFDIATLRPTYRLLIGVPGRSNAFAISRRLGIPESVVERADALISSESRRFEAVVQSLESARLALETEHQQVEQLRSEQTRSNQRYEQRIAEFEKERAALLEKAKEDARRMIDMARAKSAQLVNELEDLKKQVSSQNAGELARRARAAMKAGLDSLADVADPIENRVQREYTLPRPLQQGDQVRIIDIDKTATVLEPPDSSGQVLVLAGIIKTRVPLENLQLAGGSSRQTQKPRRTVTGTASRAERAVSAELDLRGQSADEALMILDQFIDNAVLSGITQITIIHGKGTGVLRTAVQQHLRRHQNVRTHRLGVFGEGENGVTIAELK